MSKNENKQLNVGVLIGCIHKFHPRDLVQGIYQAAGDYHVNVLFFLGTQRTNKDSLFQGYDNIENYNYQINTIYDYADLAGLDALIISHGTIGLHLDEEERESFLDKFAHIPYIVLEEEYVDGSYIISDNYSGMKKIMEHLIDVHKYRRIAYISGPAGNTDAAQRKVAYLDAMKENLLPVPDDYIKYGDYSVVSGEIVGELLDAHPEIQAVVCANDDMALGAYEVCKARGMNVGVDIAITGYDNCRNAQTADPPLTTVNQNGYDMGYRALKELIHICEGNYKAAVKTSTDFCQRSSCGCLVRKKDRKNEADTAEKMLNDLDEAVNKIAGKCVLNMENEALVAYVTQHIEEVLDFCVSSCITDEDSGTKEFDKNYLRHLLRRIINSKYERLISSKALLEELSGFLMKFMSDKLTSEKRVKLLTAVTTVQEYVNSNMLRQQDEEFNNYKNKSSMGPFFERKLMENIYDEKQVYFECINQLKMLGVRGAYICVNKQPVDFPKGKEWKKPEELYIAAYFNRDNLMAFEENERVCINAERGLMHVHDNRSGRRYMAFSLYAGEYQYGLLVCDIEPRDISSVYIYSLTLGSVLRFMQMSKKERQIQRKLENSMRLLQEKNKVLGFISAYDELTGMLNRRGFGEKAFEFTKKNQDKTSYFVFADLDHLKEINDKYGHPEGDFAIIQCARVLNSQCGENDITGRMGGDEFMMMISSDEEDFATKFKENVKKAFEELNKRSNKPFYVEASIGVKPFLCDDEFELSSVLQQADKVMYEAKKTRRATISRD